MVPRCRLLETPAAVGSIYLTSSQVEMQWHSDFYVQESTIIKQQLKEGRMITKESNLANVEVLLLFLRLP